MLEVNKTMEFFREHRIIYLDVFAFVLLGWFYVFHSGWTEGHETDITALKLITSGITLVAFVITIGEIAGMKTINKIVKKEADLAVSIVNKQNDKIASIDIIRKTDLIKLNIEANKYIASGQSLYDVIHYINNIFVDELQNPNSNISVILARLERLETQLALCNQRRVVLSDHELKNAVFALRKAQNIIQSKFGK